MMSYVSVLLTYCTYVSMLTHCATGVERFLRDAPPAHFSVNIESFSVLANLQTEKYESSAFDANGAWYYSHTFSI